MAIFKKSFMTITVNGRTYSSVDEMPPDVREQYEKAMSLLADRNGNGIPDVLEGQTEATRVRTVVKEVVAQTGKLDGLQLPGPPPTSASRIAQSSWSSEDSSGGVTMSWPTLLALLATVAVVAAAVVWYAHQ
jgi:hypothetical protein